MLELASLLSRNARYRPDAIAVVFEERRLTYAQFWARVDAHYQRVSRVVVMKEFPRSAAGKTLKRELREPYWAGNGRKI